MGLAAPRPLLSLLALVLGCGDAPGPTRAEHEALLQRLDAMERRLDELEEPTRPEPSSRDRPPPRAAVAPGPFLPRISTDVRAAGRRPTLRVSLDADGIAIDGARLGRTEAVARFEEVAREAPDTRLVVVSEPEVSYPTMVDVLDLAREAGLTDIEMSARVHGDGDDPEAARLATPAR